MPPNPTRKDNPLDAFLEAMGDGATADPRGHDHGGPGKVPPGVVPFAIPPDHPLALAVAGLISGVHPGGHGSGAPGTNAPPVPAIDFDPVIVAKAMRHVARMDPGMDAGRRAGILALADALEVMPGSWLKTSIAILVAVEATGERACYDASERRWLAAHQDQLARVMMDMRGMAAREDAAEADAEQAEVGHDDRRGIVSRLCGWAAVRLARLAVRAGG